MKFLLRIQDHLAEIIIVSVYLYAISPLFLPPHGIYHHAFIGAFLCGLSYFCIDKEKEISKIYSILITGVLVFGITGMFFLEGIKQGESLTIAQQSLSCFFGALAGLIFVGACEGFVDNGKGKKTKKT